jgi:hypothetical protein
LSSLYKLSSNHSSTKTKKNLFKILKILEALPYVIKCILEKLPWAVEKNVYSEVVKWHVLYIYT